LPKKKFSKTLNKKKKKCKIPRKNRLKKIFGEGLARVQGVAILSPSTTSETMS
jgi:hypothetical protein